MIILAVKENLHIKQLYRVDMFQLIRNNNITLHYQLRNKYVLSNNDLPPAAHHSPGINLLILIDVFFFTQ
jgi:hypothetical protein